MKTNHHLNARLFTCAFAALLAVSLLSGCRSRTPKVQINQSESVGQQLQDLDAAYQKGIITQKEYERLKSSIIKKND